MDRGETAARLPMLAPKLLRQEEIVEVEVPRQDSEGIARELNPVTQLLGTLVEVPQGECAVEADAFVPKVGTHGIANAWGIEKNVSADEIAEPSLDEGCRILLGSSGLPDVPRFPSFGEFGTIEQVQQVEHVETFEVPKAQKDSEALLGKRGETAVRVPTLVTQQIGVVTLGVATVKVPQEEYVEGVGRVRNADAQGSNSLGYTRALGCAVEPTADGELAALQEELGSLRREWALHHERSKGLMMVMELFGHWKAALAWEKAMKIVHFGY